MKLLKYKGIFFDEFTEDEFGTWAEMCYQCAGNYRSKVNDELDRGSACGACSVCGCHNTGEDTELDHYYIDFDSAEIEFIEVIDQMETHYVCPPVNGNEGYHYISK